MKVLIACDVDSYPNPYVSTLYKGFLRKGIDVTCSIREFWTNAIAYDIIHIQWPNLLIDKSDEVCSRLQTVIYDIKKHGIPLISTCHNLIPHYNTDIDLITAYKIVYNNSDYIHHLGEASIGMLKCLYPDMRAEHFVIPHHTYDELYDLSISKENARKRLGIPKDVKCILSVGMFRHDEERKILIDLRKELNKNEYYILAPGFFWTNIIRRNIFLAIRELIRALKYYIIANHYGIRIRRTFVPDDILPLYLRAADIMLIQRKKILNSGNVSLAMLAGLPIVGPNDGNVGYLLRETKNFVFNPSSLDNLPSLIKSALATEGLGKNNDDYAKNNLTTSVVVSSFVSFYFSCLEK